MDTKPAAPWPPRLGDVWTEADLERMPDRGHKYEIIDGRLIVTPMQSETHQGHVVAVTTALCEMAPAAWRVRQGIGVRLPGGNVVPDIAVLRPEAPHEGVWNDAAHMALIVEVASASTSTYDATDKAVAYACAGIPWYWRVVPSREGAIHLYAFSGVGEYSRHATVGKGETHTLTEPFPITVDASKWLDPDR